MDLCTKEYSLFLYLNIRNKNNKKDKTSKKKQVCALEGTYLCLKGRPIIATIRIVFLL